MLRLTRQLLICARLLWLIVSGVDGETAIAQIRDS
jgi:hypothetical protein